MAMIVFGSRDDAEPAFALAFALTQRGHEAVVVVAEDVVDFGRSIGVDTRLLTVNAREFLQSEEGERMPASGDTQSYIAGLIMKKHGIADAIHEDMLSIVPGADLIASTRLIEGDAASLSEWAGVPFVPQHYAPARSNSALRHHGSRPTALRLRRTSRPTPRSIRGSGGRTPRMSTGYG
jgi:UDP:flavonoid glycosyltransferase YjiC (YdhE family)